MSIRPEDFSDPGLHLQRTSSPGYSSPGIQAEDFPHDLFDSLGAFGDSDHLDEPYVPDTASELGGETPSTSSWLSDHSRRSIDSENQQLPPTDDLAPAGDIQDFAERAFLSALEHSTWNVHELEEQLAEQNRYLSERRRGGPLDDIRMASRGQAHRVASPELPARPEVSLLSSSPPTRHDNPERNSRPMQDGIDTLVDVEYQADNARWHEGPGGVDHLPPPPSRNHARRNGGRRQVHLVEHEADDSAQLADNDVIDLTNEPDSPVREHHPPGSHSTSQNARRRNTHGRSNPPPALSRSDSSRLGNGGGPQVIDLTEEAPEPAIALPGGRPPRHHFARRRPRAEETPDVMFVNHRQRTPPAQPQSRAPPPSGPWITNPLGPFGRWSLFPSITWNGRGAGANQRVSDLVQAFNPVGNINLMYQHHPFNDRRPASPKPVYEPPPSAEEGFTRDTGGDTAFVCPCCDRDLEYEPLDSPSENQTSARPAQTGHRGKKRKRNNEHHFWAVKECGHVYCDDCFENRKSKRGVGTGFRGEGKTYLCAIDGCNSNISAKGSWVGIYL